MKPSEHAFKLAENMRDLVSRIDVGRLSRGNAEQIAKELQSLASQIKPFFSRYNLETELDLVGAALVDFCRPRGDRADALMRLEHAVYGVYMRAHGLAHPPVEDG